MRFNRTLQKLTAGGTVFGSAMQFYPSAEIPRVFAAAGFDYFFIDLEHGIFDFQTVANLIASAAAAGITPLVRPADLLYPLVARLLDLGAQGIVLPRVEDPGLLREALSWMKFPPAGRRGFGVPPATLDYERHSFPDIIQHANENVMSVVQFETQLSLDRADEMLSLPGVDVAMIGPSDLSISLGVPGEFENPVLVKAVERFIAQCNEHGVAPGIHPRSVEDAKPWIERGMRLIGVASEQAFFIERARQARLELSAAGKQK